MNAAYLYAQLELADEINDTRRARFTQYEELLRPLADSGRIELPYVPDYCEHNGHMFYIKTSGIDERAKLIDFLHDKGVHAVFHYIPLHTAPAGLKYGRFNGEDKYTTVESERLLRLPMFYKLTEDEVTYITEQVVDFYESNR